MLAAIHCSMKFTSSGAMNGDEHRYSRTTLAGSSPTRAQNSSRVVLGLHYPTDVVAAALIASLLGLLSLGVAGI